MNAIEDELEDAVAVVDAFHIVKLGGQASTGSAVVCSSRPSAPVGVRVTRCTESGWPSAAGSSG